MSNQKMIIALLGVVAVLLAVIVGVLLFKSPSSDIAAVDPSALQQQQVPSTTGTGTSAPSGMGQQAPAPAGPFDPAKATKVVGDPKAHVDKYFSAIVKKDWKTAYDLLPVDKKSSYGSADSFGQQLASYGANGYKMGAVQTKGDQETVSATLQTSGGGFTYNWTFVKYNGGWVVKSREIGGMGQ